MAAEPVSLVTPHGVRDGDPAALSGLTERRGAAVLAYTTRVAAPGLAVEAAADAFARFRGAVVLAADPHEVDPERTLLRGTRYAAALVAPVEVPLRIRLRGGSSPFPCALVPELLAARAERELTEADRARLVRHLGRCAACRAAEERFRAGEHAYRDAPLDPPPPAAAREIMRALLAAAARVGANGPALHAVEDPAPTPFDAPPVIAADAPSPFDALPAPATPLHLRTDTLERGTIEFDAHAFANEGREPVLLPETAGDETTAAQRQPTFEFDALPVEVFGSVLVATDPSWAARALRILLVALIVVALAAAVVACAGVLRA